MPGERVSGARYRAIRNWTVHQFNGALKRGLPCVVRPTRRGEDYAIDTADAIQWEIAEGMNGGKLTGYISDVVDDTTTARQLAKADSGKTLRFTGASAITVTVPGSAVSAFVSKGFKVKIIQAGLGQITFATSGGMALVNRQGHTKTAGRYAAVELEVNALNECVLSGDTAA